MIRRLLLAVLVPALGSTLHAAPPPELMALQQTYAFAFAERVTVPYETGISALNTKFTTALAAAAAAAKKGGRLPDLIAIEEDVKRIADKAPLPAEDDDKTPEALKTLRGIYRAEETKLVAQRSANHSTLLPAYLGKLKALETTLTQTDRVAEAKEVLAYREGLTADAPAVVVTMTGAGETKPAPPAAAVDDPTLPKADERQAAEWVLGVGGSIDIKEGSKPAYTLNSKAGLPKGRFVLLKIVLDGKKTTQPVTAEGLKGLAGLRDLTSLFVDNLELADDDLAVIGTLPSLQSLNVSHNGQFTGTATRHLVRLRDLDGFVTLSTPFNDDAVALLAECKALTQVQLGDTAITDACIPHLNKMSKLASLQVGSSRQMTPEGLAQIKLKLSTMNFNIRPGESLGPVVALLAQTQPQLSKVAFSHTIHDDGIAALKALPKLVGIYIAGTATEKILDGLDAVPGLGHCLCGKDFPITDAGLMKFVPLKKLKSLSIFSTLVTDAGVAAFNKARPDVKVTRK